jgi:hypothetical protein
MSCWYVGHQSLLLPLLDAEAFDEGTFTMGRVDRDVAE